MAVSPRHRHRLVLGVFLIVWGFSLAMRFGSLERMSPNHVAVERRGADEYPVVAGFEGPGAEVLSNLEVGDRLLRAGDRDLRGLGQFGYAIQLVDYSWRHAGPCRSRSNATAAC